MKTRYGKATLILLLVVFVVLAVAVLAVWLGGDGTPRVDVDAGRAAADEFLQLIRDGNADNAWQLTTAEFKSAEGRESFSRYVKLHPELRKPVDFVSVQMVTVQGQPRAEYLYRAGKDGGMIRLLAGYENGNWRVDRLAME